MSGSSLIISCWGTPKDPWGQVGLYEEKRCSPLKCSSSLHLGSKDRRNHNDECTTEIKNANEKQTYSTIKFQKRHRIDRSSEHVKNKEGI